MWPCAERFYVKTRITAICLWVAGSELCRCQNFCMMLPARVAQWLPSVKVAGPVLSEEKKLLSSPTSALNLTCVTVGF